jgi:dihydrofolate synthase/folylpolyglutamate synthase
MDYQTAIAYLERHIGRGMKPGLGRIRQLLDDMGKPDEGFPIIHVAGTNGKTSTSRMAALLCVAHGLSTGTFISPHLERIEERFGANGQDATPEELALAVSDVAAFADLLERRSGETLTYFELTAAAAFAFFAEKAVEAAVVEVGLGGRLDATNAIHGDVAVITGIDLDHTETLGETIEAIAAEKLGIVKPGAILITGPLPERAVSVTAEVVRTLGVEHRAYGRDFRVAAAERAVGGWYCTILGAEDSYEEIFLPMHGRHQTRNLAVAAAATEALLGRGLRAQSVRRAAAVMTSPGRMEPITSHPLILLDGAHNPEGFRTLAVALEEEFANRRFVLVLAAMEDKDLAGMLPHLRGHVERVIATTVGSPRSLAPDTLAARAAAELAVPAESAPTPVAAIERARDGAGTDGAVLVAGSLYLVGTVRSHLLGHPAARPNER